MRFRFVRTVRWRVQINGEVGGEFERIGKNMWYRRLRHQRFPLEEAQNKALESIFEKCVQRRKSTLEHLLDKLATAWLCFESLIFWTNDDGEIIEIEIIEG